MEVTGGKSLSFSGQVLEASHAAIVKTLAPLADHLRGHVQLPSNLLVLQPLGAQENRAGPNDIAERCRIFAREPLENARLVFRENYVEWTFPRNRRLSKKQIGPLKYIILCLTFGEMH